MAKKRTQAENFAIRQKTQEMIAQGYKTEQAQAIAFRMYRDDELLIPDMKLGKQAQQDKNKMSASRSTNAIYLLYRLARALSNE